jgi:hypothetical protein
VVGTSLWILTGRKIMTDKALLTSHVERIASHEHLLKVIQMYATKWHSLEQGKLGMATSGRDTTFVTGRQTGYVEVISALLDVSYGSVHEMLRNHQL